MDDHRAQVEELLADYRRSREQLASVQRELAAVSGRASSPDGTVTATVGTGGKLVGLELSELAYRRHRPEQLAELIVQTVAAAAASAAEDTYKTLSTVLPPSTDPAALVADGERAPQVGVAAAAGLDHHELPGPERRRQPALPARRLSRAPGC